MIKVYFGNDESKKYIGESETEDGAYQVMVDYVADVLKKDTDNVYYCFARLENGDLIVDYGSHSHFFYFERI